MLSKSQIGQFREYAPTQDAARLKTIDTPLHQVEHDEVRHRRSPPQVRDDAAATSGSGLTTSRRFSWRNPSGMRQPPSRDDIETAASNGIHEIFTTPLVG
jgi:hypothetical protein